MSDRLPGYHLREIKRGKYGDVSKIREELDELEDAEAQGCRIMALVEVADMYGAIVAYVQKHHPGTTMDDIILMYEVTRRAFENGHRAPR
jgi:hypothetical protein